MNQLLTNAIRTQLQKYFNSPAYAAKQEKRFAALKIILHSMLAGVKGGNIALHGLMMPKQAEIEQITNCSTCPGVATKTKNARSLCESFAVAWLSRSDPKNTNSQQARSAPITPPPANKNDFAAMVAAKKAKQVPYETIVAKG